MTLAGQLEPGGQLHSLPGGEQGQEGQLLGDVADAQPTKYFRSLATARPVEPQLASMPRRRAGAGAASGQQVEQEAGLAGARGAEDRRETTRA